MKMMKTICKLVEEAERDYYLACDKCADEKTVKKLERNFMDSLELMRKINNIQKDEEIPNSTI